jgi:protoheme IX farnesyltransferase
MSVVEGSIASLVMGVAGVALIAVYMNYLSAMLGFAALVLYAFVYTPLKKIHPIAVLVGAFPGALPTLIGYTAASNSINYEAMLLFTIQFLWQFPHFWAIAWRLHTDYQKAGIQLLPESGAPGKKTALQTLIYTLTLIPVGLLMPIMGYTGWVSAAVVLACALYFAYTAGLLYKNCDRQTARRLMFGSYIYLPTVQLAWAFDKL